MKRTLIYDIEVLPNCFLAVFLDAETRRKFVIEKSDRMDNTSLLAGVMNNSYIVGYNSMMYDNVVCNYIMKENPSCQQIYEWSNYIITKREDKDYWEKIHEYKHNNNYETIDLMTMLFSKKLRVSLKHLQVMLKWHNLLESEIPFDTWLNEEQVDVVLNYCHNDVDFTAYLYDWCKKDIAFRFDLNKEYGINTLSSDPVKIGTDLMTKFISEKLYRQHFPNSIHDENEYIKKLYHIKVRETRLEAKPFYLGEIVNDFIKYDSPILNNLLDKIKNFKYQHKENYFSERIIYKNTIYDIGSGGLHSYFPKPVIIQPGKDELYQQADYKSYYPSQRVFLEYKHEIWGDLFSDEDKAILYGRWQAQKEGNDIKSAAFKLLGNSLFGQFGNEHSQFMSPKLANAQTINGQLMILMMIEWLEEAGINVVASNTDSVDIIFPKNLKDTVAEIGNKFTKMTNGIQVEFDDIAKAIYGDINCYYMLFTNGKVKEKGRWVTHYKWKDNEPVEYNPQMLNKGFWSPVVNIALRKYFIDNVPVEVTIRNHPDILDYCMSQKVDRSYNIWHGQKNLVEDFMFGNLHNTGDTKMKGVTKQQQINRWYASTNGGFLYKERNNNYYHLLKNQGVTILNKCDTVDRTAYKNIDYNFYIREANKIINEVEPKQLTLF